MYFYSEILPAPLPKPQKQNCIKGSTCNTIRNFHEYISCCQVASVVSDSVRPHRRQPTRLPRPWDSPGKNTGVGCHFLLQGMKVKSESEVAQSCLTPSNPMDCSLPGYIHCYCIKQIVNKDPLYSTENSTQYSVMAYMKKNVKKKQNQWIYV